MSLRRCCPQGPRPVVMWRRFARVCVGGMALAGSLACQVGEGTELLEVGGVEPTQVHFGSPWTVVGDGFALGKQALVTLDGTVYRAGHASRDVRFSVRAATQSKERLKVVLPREAQALACGDPEDASHATFRGNLQVAIAAKSPGAPPVTGTLRGATLELYPAAKTRRAEQTSARRTRELLAFVGVELAVAPEGGLWVVSTEEGGRAAQSGLRPADRIVRAAGVSVLRVSDLLSEPSRKLSLLVVRGRTERRLDVSIDGLSPSPSRALAWASLPVGAAALLLLLRGLSPIGVFGALNPQRTRGSSRQIGVWSPQSGYGESRLRWTLLLSWACAALLLVCANLGRSVGPLEQPAMLLLPMLAGSAAMSGVQALVRAGRVSAQRWSLVKGGGAALSQLVFLFPAATSLGRALYQSGFDFARSSEIQGATPWEWSAFANPGDWILFCLFVLTPLASELGVTGVAKRERSQRLSAALQRGWSDLYLCSTAAVATLLFLGASKLPSWGLGLPGLASLWLVAKYSLLVFVLFQLRRCAQGVTRRQRLFVGGGVAVPLSIVGLGLSIAWGSLRGRSPMMAWLDQGFGTCLCLALGGVAALLAWRWLNPHPTRSVSSDVSPWL